MTTPIEASLWLDNAQYFGRDHLGAIKGASFVFAIAGAALGPLPFAASADWTGSYAIVLTVCCGLCLVCGAAAFLVRRPHPSARLVITSEPTAVAGETPRG